ncbi:MAG: undecaprenyl/decaprenyl-phosphate alpha-N-acetylglucosaminyl 1-phosphate transferase [Spirochaetaceae bacterium]|nr:MAG: undecaprenyl/decaprenyl-phosphate alpha-N-acetylglucosaminyl 1-phosphate transferase [Spirochaetaceae bacterium]
MIVPALIATALSLGLALLLIPTIRRMAHRFKWYDLPNNRKIHTGLIPRLGGPGMYLSFVAAALLAPLLVTLVTGGSLRPRYNLGIVPFLLGITLIHTIGLIDDFHNLKALLKFFIQILAAAIITSGGFLIRSLTLPYLGTVPLGLLAYPITVLWIVGISNAINLIDGTDGLAGGISGFAALSMGIISLLQGAVLTSVLCFALFGAIAGFLVFNYPPAKIFMGDSGSLFLGACLASIPLAGGISKISAFGTLLVPVTLLTIPILDMITSVIRRLRNKMPIIHPDKEHIHHKLLDMGLNPWQILWVLYGFSIYLSVVAITSVILPEEVNVYLILVVWAGSLLGYGLLYFMNTRKRSVNSVEAEDEDQSPSARGFPKSG